MARRFWRVTLLVAVIAIACSETGSKPGFRERSPFRRAPMESGGSGDDRYSILEARSMMRRTPNREEVARARGMTEPELLDEIDKLARSGEIGTSDAAVLMEHVYRRTPTNLESWAATMSGRTFRPFVPSAEEIDVTDVIHSLSHVCRFGGHCSRFYSVAEHSLLVERLARVWIGRPELSYQALLHDAPEAYVGDMIAPIRRGLPDFEALYGNVERVVFEALGVPLELDPDVKRADLMALAIEARDLFAHDEWKRWDLPCEPLPEFGVSAEDPGLTYVRSEFRDRLIGSKP